jgi:hypothetical protein
VFPNSPFNTYRESNKFNVDSDSRASDEHNSIDIETSEEETSDEDDDTKIEDEADENYVDMLVAANQIQVMPVSQMLKAALNKEGMQSLAKLISRIFLSKKYSILSTMNSGNEANLASKSSQYEAISFFWNLNAEVRAQIFTYNDRTSFPLRSMCLSGYDDVISKIALMLQYFDASDKEKCRKLLKKIKAKAARTKAQIPTSFQLGVLEAALV